MSELTGADERGRGFRRGLLASASIVALIGLCDGASADDADRPQLWIELGGQFEGMTGGSEPFTAPFFANLSPADSAVMFDAQKPRKSSIGSQARISFQPEASDWVFSVAVRFGRSNGNRHLHHQTEVPPVTATLFGNAVTQTASKQIFGDAQTDQRETHTIIDFQAGKDVGLGLFGRHGQSVISGGVRFAQFASSANATIHARPIDGFDPAVSSPGKYKIHDPFHRTYTAIAHADRSTRALGPSLSWNSTAPFAGDGENAEFTFDWGLNAAILFGRQRAHTHHQTTGYFYHLTGGLKFLINGNPDYLHKTHYTHHPADSIRSQSVTIPNLGGFAGVSLKFPNAKVSLGYRADFFFGAADGGIDATKKENRGFYGPFATLSFGIGG